MGDDKAAALRALLDEAGLVGATVRMGIRGLAPDEPYAEACGEGIWGAGAAAQAREVAAMVTSRHDEAAAAIGLPSAAEVRALVAEVERLRAVVASVARDIDAHMPSSCPPWASAEVDSDIMQGWVESLRAALTEVEP